MRRRPNVTSTLGNRSEIVAFQSRRYWKYHAPTKLLRQASISGRVNNDCANLVFDTGAEISILDIAFFVLVGPMKGQLNIWLDFTVSAGIRLDLANETLCLPDEAQVKLLGRRTLHDKRVSDVKLGRYVQIPVVVYVEVPLKRSAPDSENADQKRRTWLLPNIARRSRDTYLVGEGPSIKRAELGPAGSRRYAEWLTLA
ncbi:unnamed protein product [Peronospora belbahrii]|uniref:Peptidase A2 domain-containing protein n=1 Tax=Peronospora belbahrii TaxID=622444 RepID=A0ABN8D8S9_9STRA|nr:unnamed protein product [Peronospora belbahrii]